MSGENSRLSVLSHEVRTPITVIKGLASTLLHRHELTEQEVDGYVAQIVRQGERLERLLDQLLDNPGSGPEGLPVVLDEISVAIAVTTALIAAPPPSHKSIVLDVPDHLRVRADPDRLEQVLVNLLTNAYRYGVGAIYVDAYAAADGVVLTVSDDGAGVPAEFVPDLFERFTRGANSTAHLGCGLGLAIARHMTEAIGGRLSYEPRRPRGACFTIHLCPIGERADGTNEGDGPLCGS